MIHHKRSHGESLATVEKKCRECGEVFEAYEYRGRKVCSKTCRNKMFEQTFEGEQNHNWKEPVVLSCEWCDNEFEVPEKRKDSARFCSYDCANRWKSEAWTGESHHNWNGGSLNYYGANWLKMRRRVVERDQMCRICRLQDGRLEVHHIVPIKEFENPEDANREDNLILLCSKCHHNVEHGNIDCPKHES